MMTPAACRPVRSTAARASLGPLAFALAAGALASSGCGVYVPERYAEDVRWDGGFGRASVGVVPAAGFFGEVKGIAPGVGAMVEFPPLVPVVYVGSVAAAATVTAPLWLASAALDGDGELAAQVAGEIVGGLVSGAAASGVLGSGVSNPSRLLLSDFSMDLAFVTTTHEDQTYGGRLSYTAGMLGVRVGASRGFRPRPYLCGGWGWYVFEYDAPLRSDATVGGPWVGCGAEFFAGRWFALALDARAHFYFGVDDANAIVDGGMAHGSVMLSWYW